MAEQLTPAGRLQPALLDRLTDEEPDKKLEPRERACSLKPHARTVLRDLAWLFNTTRLDADTDLDAAQARRSVINYGLPALSGRRRRRSTSPTSTRAIRQAILDFEPRILPAHAQVSARSSPAPRSSQRDRRRNPRPALGAAGAVELLVRTEIDLETGQVRDRRLAPSRSA